MTKGLIAHWQLRPATIDMHPDAATGEQKPPEQVEMEENQPIT